jgi:outer membrane protein OmpA-like peptidoglycan-associated protein
MTTQRQDSDGSRAAAQRAWLATALNVNVKRSQSAGAASSSTKSSGGAARKAPPAVGTTLFFEHDSPDLTPSDREAIEAYAKAYLDAKSSDPITVDGYASSEGDARHNQELSDNRAKEVAKHLVKLGVPTGQVTTAGHGATTQFSKDDLSQNRRATIKPPPPKARASPAPPARPAGTGGGTLSMRDPKPLGGGATDAPLPHAPAVPLGGDKAAEKVVGTNTDVSRATVEKALKEFLHDLAKTQKTKTVRATDIVWTAEGVLRRNLTDAGEPVVKRGDTTDYDPDELAAKIAGQLPDAIPRKNFDEFLKLKPREVPDAGSTTDQLRRKYEEKREEIVRKLPKAAQGPARKAMDAAVEKGVPFVADKALKGLGIDSTVEGEMKKAVEDYAKKVTGGDK